MLIFEETPLRDIVEDFNRYNRRKLEIVDPAMGNVQIGGRYRPRDVEGFLQNLATVMQIRVSEDHEEDGGRVVLRLYPAEKDR
jgi:transmembrane sensor